MKTIAIYNNKGGVAKTTSAINIAASLSAIYKYRVLVVDLDSQCCLTEFATDEGELIIPFTRILERTAGHAGSIKRYTFTCYRPSRKKRAEAHFDVLPCDSSLAYHEFEGINDLKKLLKL